MLDPTGKVIRYSIENDFVYIDEFVFRDYIPAAHNICKISKDEYVLFSRSAEKQLYKCSFLNKSLDPIDYSFPKWLLFTPFMSAQTPFYQYGGQSFYFDQLDGRIYELNSCGMKLRLIWDLGEYHLKRKEIPPQKSTVFYQNFYKKSSYRYITRFTSIQETDTFIIAQCSFRNQGTLLIYDKQNNTVQSIHRTIEGFKFVPGTIMNNTMYLFTRSDLITQYYNGHQLSDTEPDDNYALLKYYLK